MTYGGLMLKINTKFRFIIAFYMAIPLSVMIIYAKDTPLFQNPDFQGVLGICLAVSLLLLVCSPFLWGLRWLFLGQLTNVTKACTGIKKGRYTFFTLPNEPSFDSGENEMVALMRDMNWMIRQIQSRETELEGQVVRRTQALEETNAALVSARDAANASARSKSEFLATMSHEIRTPMNAIINLSGLALKRSLDPNQKEYLEIIHSSSSALLGIINDILDFSKMDADKLRLETIPLDIRNIFEEIMDMFKCQISDSPVEMILDIDPTVPETILGDPLRLRQVLTNLISNAVKFTKQGKILIHVDVGETDEQSASLNFSVMDTGVGINSNALSTLFTPFTQEDGSTTREFGGTGLGLAISQKLVGLMGGTITAESHKGEGACFSFTLTVNEPEYADKKAPLPGIPAARQTQTPEKLKILIVEDNQINQIVAREIFKSVGIDPVIVSGGQQAIDQIESQDYHAVIMDVQMPGMDGYQTTRIIREKGYDTIPIIAMTANAMAEDRQKGMYAGMTAYITKPVDPDTLFSTMETCLGIHIPQPENSDTTDRPQPLLHHDALPEELPGFDVEDAMKRLKGDMDTFKEVILQFYADNKDMVTFLYHVMSDQTALDAEIHRIKGVCATLSATALHRAVSDLETLVKGTAQQTSPQHPEIQACMRRIETEMVLVEKTVQNLSDPIPRDPQNSVSHFPNDTMEKIEELGQLIEQNSLSAKAFSKKLAAELSGTSLSPEAHQLEIQIKRFEFTKARQTFKNLSDAFASAIVKTAEPKETKL